MYFYLHFIELSFQLKKNSDIQNFIFIVTLEIMFRVKFMHTESFSNNVCFSNLPKYIV